jgi:hypothetical protein
MKKKINTTARKKIEKKNTKIIKKSLPFAREGPKNRKLPPYGR